MKIKINIDKFTVVNVISHAYEEQMNESYLYVNDI